MGYNPPPPPSSRRPLPPPPKGQSGQSGLNKHKKDNKCPNCGAISKSGMCEYCGYEFYEPKGFCSSAASYQILDSSPSSMCG